MPQYKRAGLDTEKQACLDVYQGAMRTNELVDSMVGDLGKEPRFLDFVYETSWLYGVILGGLVALQMAVRVFTIVARSSGATAAGDQEMKSRSE